jgi:hypothetical protein
MFRSKLIISIIIFFIFLIATSVIKNKTRITEKKINILNKKIVIKERDINESQLEFYFLNSPAEIEKKVITLGLIDYAPIKYSNFFLNLSDFTNLSKKMSKLINQNEKKEK